jgi:hypothetical protein
VGTINPPHPTTPRPKNKTAKFYAAGTIGEAANERPLLKSAARPTLEKDNPIPRRFPLLCRFRQGGPETPLTSPGGRMPSAARSFVHGRNAFSSIKLNDGNLTIGTES